MSKLTRAMSLAVLLTAGAVASMFPQKAAAVDLSGKTVEWIIPFGEGGGSDKWARFYAPLLSDALPGSPNVVVKNMPGAGSTKGANWFASRAKPNGLTIFGSGGSTQFPFLLGDERVKYDYADWNIVLASASGGVVYLPKAMGDNWNKDPKSVIESQTFIVGSQGATRLDLVALLAWDMLGMKVKPVFGIKGRGAGRLMFERGDANIDWQTSSGFLSKVKPLVDEGLAVPIMTFGAIDDKGDLVRDPTFPNLPTFKEVYEKVYGKAPSGDAWEAWKAFFVAGFSAQKMVFLPKGSSPELIAAYDKAFGSIIKGNDFAKSSGKILGVYPQSIGDTAKTKLKLGTEVSDSAKKWIKGWLARNYEVKLTK
jgi:tripartite-type tricarboxylate transporter receptor subunit TctC